MAAEEVRIPIGGNEAGDTVWDKDQALSRDHDLEEAHARYPGSSRKDMSQGVYSDESPSDISSSSSILKAVQDSLGRESPRSGTAEIFCAVVDEREIQGAAAQLFGEDDVEMRVVSSCGCSCLCVLKSFLSLCNGALILAGMPIPCPFCSFVFIILVHRSMTLYCAILSLQNTKACIHRSFQWSRSRLEFGLSLLPQLDFSGRPSILSISHACEITCACSLLLIEGWCQDKVRSDFQSTLIRLHVRRATPRYFLRKGSRS